MIATGGRAMTTKRKPKRNKEASMNFRLKPDVKRQYDAMIEAMEFRDRRGDAFGLGQVLEWFMATLVSAPERERAETLERLQDGMERWAAQHAGAAQAEKKPSGDPGAVMHGVGGLAPAAEVAERLDDHAPRRRDRKQEGTKPKR